MPQFNGINPDVMRLEMRHVDPHAPPKRKLSGGAKFARALGSFLGPVSMAASIFFPPAAIGGLAAYGLKNKANQALNQQQAIINAEQQAHAAKGPRQIEYVGYTSPNQTGGVRPGSIQPASTAGVGAGRGPGQDEVMNVLFLRQGAADQAIHNTNYQGN